MSPFFHSFLKNLPFVTQFISHSFYLLPSAQFSHCVHICCCFLLGFKCQAAAAAAAVDSAQKRSRRGRKGKPTCESDRPVRAGQEPVLQGCFALDVLTWMLVRGPLSPSDGVCF